MRQFHTAKHLLFGVNWIPHLTSMVVNQFQSELNPQILQKYFASENFLTCRTYFPLIFQEYSHLLTFNRHDNFYSHGRKIQSS